MTFLKRIFNKEVSKMQNSEAAREELPPIDQPYIFSPTKKNSKYLKKGILPRHYEKGLNCFLDSIDDPGIRQAAYEELLMTPGGLTLDLSREAGALFGVKNLIVCTDIYNKAAQRLNKPEVAAYGIPKKGIVRLMLEGSKMKMTFIFKPQMLPSGRMIGHAESHGPTDIVLDSQDFFERGLACQKRGETKLIFCGLEVNTLNQWNPVTRH